MNAIIADIIAIVTVRICIILNLKIVSTWGTQRNVNTLTPKKMTMHTRTKDASDE